MYTVFVCDIGLQSDKGMEMMTPFPVPTHSRLQEIIRAVILTKEKPSFPVPVKDTRKCIQLFIYSKAYIKELKSSHILWFVDIHQHSKVWAQ